MKQQTVSPLSRQVLSWINSNGPFTFKRLEKEASLHYHTVKPVVDELVSNGALRRDDKPLAKAGNPVYHHLTTRGVKIIVEDWDTISLFEKTKATNSENYSDLGLVSDLVTDLEKSLEPSRVKSTLWSTLFFGGIGLVFSGPILAQIGTSFGLAFIAIAAILFYDDYVRERLGVGRPISIEAQR